MIKFELYTKRNTWLDSCKPVLTQLVSGLRFLEGPVWIQNEKKLIFSDIQGNALYCLSNERDLSFLRVNSYLTNGNTLDLQGNLISCETGTSRVVRLNLKDDGYEVLVSHFEGKELNSPNDVIVSKKGDIYFTDPLPGRMGRVGIPRKAELDFQGVYRFIESTGELQLLDDTLILPNGLCFDPQENILYVNDSKAKKIYQYLHGKKDVFATVEDEGDGVLDGMKCCKDGTIICTGPGGLYFFDVDGTKLAKIFFPEVTANFTFGENEQTLYVTASSSVYKLMLNR